MLPISRPRANEEIEIRLSWRDWRPTLVAAALASVAVLSLLAAFGSVSAYERPVALASLTASVYWLAAALVGACGTIAALTLATLGLMEQLETRRMGPRFLLHLRLAVLAAFATIVLAVAALLVTMFPSASGTDVSPPRWQVDAASFGLLALTALMVGGFAVVLGSLYSTVADVFRNLPEAWVGDIFAAEEAAERGEPASRRHPRTSTAD